MKILLEEMMGVYEKSRPWYEVAEHPLEPKLVGGLKNCLSDIDLVLLDSYGVLCRGSDVIPEALDAIAYLKGNNIPYCIISNDTMNGRRTVESKYEKLGYTLKKSEIVTSLDVVERYLEKQDELSSFAATGFNDSALKERFPEIQDLNTDQGHVRDGVKNLLYFVGKYWESEMQENLINTSKKVQNIIVGNPDVGAPEEDTFVSTPGFYVEDFYAKTGFKKKPLLLGKPSIAIFEQTLEHINYTGKAENVLMVGDSLHTDILGGAAMGFKTLLLRSGIFRAGGAEKYIKKTGIVPNYIASTL